MRDLVIIMLGVGIVMLSVVSMFQSFDIKNLERKYCKVERYCDKIIEENEQLMRINNQTLLLLSEKGGAEW